MSVRIHSGVVIDIISTNLMRVQTPTHVRIVHCEATQKSFVGSTVDFTDRFVDAHGNRTTYPVVQSIRGC
jgi:hypothetical protein